MNRNAKAIAMLDHAGLSVGASKVVRSAASVAGGSHRRFFAVINEHIAQRAKSEPPTTQPPARDPFTDTRTSPLLAQAFAVVGQQIASGALHLDLEDRLWPDALECAVFEVANTLREGRKI